MKTMNTAHLAMVLYADSRSAWAGGPAAGGE